MRYIRILFTILIALLIGNCLRMEAQNPPDSNAIKKLLAKADSTKNLVEQDSVAKGVLEMPVFSTARDSIIEDFSNGRKIIYYYGDVSVKYGTMELKAGYMAYDLDLNTVYACGILNNNGDIESNPTMTMDGATYTMEEIYYNFKTKKSKIKNMITNQQEGKLKGENIKMQPDQSINIRGGQYTVCDADHPHYYLQMTAAKVATKPKQRTVFGPAYLVLGDVPLPIALPFGFVPDMPERSSGILIPTFGEETARGLYMRGLGAYLVFGNHFDLSITSDIYTYGSWSIKANSRYKKRYAFDGNVGITYSEDIVGEVGMPNYSKSTNFAVNWSHSQDSKARPGSTFSASVNFSTPSNNRYNSTSLNQALQNQSSSSINYGKSFTIGSVTGNLSIGAQHSQNSIDSSYAFTAPSFTFNINRFYPFKKKNRIGKPKFYEDISLSYNASLNNRVNFKMSEITKPGYNLLDNMNSGMQHRFNIGLPAFTVLKYLNFSPSVQYGMNWFFRETTQAYDPESDRVISSMSSLFSAFGVTQDFSAGISMSTRIYGTFNFKPKGKLRAIRHMITPSFSISYRPELGTPMNGYTTLEYKDKDGNDKQVEYNKYSGQGLSIPGKGQTASLGFSFGNNLEAKVFDRKDTTGVGTKKVKLIDQLTISGSYNFLADSLNLSNINISASTSVFGKLSISGQMQLDPYAVDNTGRKINTLNLVYNKWYNLARVTNASASLSYGFNGSGKINGNDGQAEADSKSSKDYYRVYYHPFTGEYIPGGWLYYSNPESPWNINIGINFSMNKSYRVEQEALKVVNNFTSTLSLSGQVKLTKALNMSMNTGFDLIKMKMTSTEIRANYDLHCFNISVSWIPNGKWESWSFRIAANASTLADLLRYNKSSSYWDNGSYR